MLGGYFEFFMKPTLGDMYLSLKRELEELIQNKVSIIFLCKCSNYLMIRHI